MVYPMKLSLKISFLTGVNMKKLFLKIFIASHLNQKGYTLIELLVAMGIFIIITSIAIGGYIRGIKTSRQAAALAAANSNVASALEQMMRELRVGFSIATCPGGCITFRDRPTSSPESKEIVYRLNSSENYIERGEGGVGGVAIPITDENVEIDYLDFRIQSLSDDYPTRIFIRIGVKTNEPGVDGGVINLQTTVSARN